MFGDPGARAASTNEPAGVRNGADYSYHLANNGVIHLYANGTGTEPSDPVGLYRPAGGRFVGGGELRLARTPGVMRMDHMHRPTVTTSGATLPSAKVGALLTQPTLPAVIVRIKGRSLPTMRQGIFIMRGRGSFAISRMANSTAPLMADTT